MAKFRIETKVIYQDDYKTGRKYQDAIYTAENTGWENVLQCSGWGTHGGYCLLVKDIEIKKETK